ncbi:sensory rhodopsin transducer [Jannaschia seosinensis]|uniref:sensory rhodopsin transducer n=1 Tax=Jannaschia seosinensis TaxID=313367 RepID=UPI0006E3008A|nr:sensory rhodopsin transducer [Jannaschia seosinensis]
MKAVGSTLWVIAEGYIPSRGIEGDRALESHEAFCLLNTGAEDAHLEIMLFFADRPPVGPYRAVVPAERTLHLRANDLDDPEPVPRDTDYAVKIASDVPVVVQHTRLDSRPENFALLSAMAHPVV